MESWGWRPSLKQDEEQADAWKVAEHQAYTKTQHNTYHKPLLLSFLYLEGADCLEGGASGAEGLAGLFEVG